MKECYFIINSEKETKHEWSGRKDCVKKRNNRGGCLSFLSSLLSPLSSRRALGGFPYIIACFLHVREIKKNLANILAGLISRLLLPVHHDSVHIITCATVSAQPYLNNNVINNQDGHWVYFWCTAVVVCVLHINKPFKLYMNTIWYNMPGNIRRQKQQKNGSCCVLDYIYSSVVCVDTVVQANKGVLIYIPDISFCFLCTVHEAEGTTATKPMVKFIWLTHGSGWVRHGQGQLIRSCISLRCPYTVSSSSYEV